MSDHRWDCLRYTSKRKYSRILLWCHTSTIGDDSLQVLSWPSTLNISTQHNTGCNFSCMEQLPDTIYKRGGVGHRSAKHQHPSDYHAPNPTECHAPNPSECHVSNPSECHAPNHLDCHAPNPSECHAPNPSECHAANPSECHAANLDKPLTAWLHLNNKMPLKVTGDIFWVKVLIKIIWKQDILLSNGNDQ